MYVSAPQISGMGSIDLSTASWEDYLLIGVVGMFAIGTLFPSVFEPSKPRPRRRRKPVSAGTGFVGGIATVALLAGLGYYVWTSGTQLGAQMAQGSAG